ncbi:CAP domain-containing protein [Mobiluncus mulieris]|nr:CAP domain-containing protein [Mobiluncus mulieris]
MTGQYWKAASRRGNPTGREKMRASATVATSIIAGFAVLTILSSTFAASQHSSDMKTLRAAGSNPGYSGELLEPAAPGNNAIDTTIKSEVQREFLKRYEKNMIRPVTSVGVKLNDCEAGQAVRDGVAPIVESWNFLRGLNGLNAVTLDDTQAINPYTQAAAMVSARNGELSHYPAAQGFACATENAVRGARHSNLAQSVSQTSAETALWYYMDYSSPKNPVNDQLGHRLFMQDPQLAVTSIGAAEGYTAISVRTGEPYPALSADKMRNTEAPTPAWISWPSAGFFPKQLLTSVGLTKDGPDMERWSFSVLNGDLSEATAKIIDPGGREVPLTVVRPGQPGVAFTPRAIADYSTLLMKFPTIERLPMGQENRVYNVHVEGVKGTAKSTYDYQVALFDPLTPLEKTAPKIHILEQPLTGVGYKMINPIRMQIEAWPMAKYQWQQRIDGGEWTNISGATSETFIPDGIWTWKRSKTTEYRLIATSTEGEAISDPIRVAVQGLKNMPASARTTIGSRAVFEAAPILDPDGSLFDTTFEWQVMRSGRWDPIYDDGHFEGTTTNRLVINRVTPADNGLQFRLVVRSKIFKLSGYDVVVSWSDGLAKLSVF